MKNIPVYLEGEKYMRLNILNKKLKLNGRLVVPLRNSGTIIEVFFIVCMGGVNNG